MYHKVAKLVPVLLLFLELLTIGSPSASANILDSATVSPTCNGYTITVSGRNLDISGVAWQVNYAILVAASDGTTFTINDSIQVFPDSSLNFSASATKPAGPATQSISLSGTATLVDSNGDSFNTVNIAFTPAALNCSQSTPPPCSASSSNTSNFNGTPIAAGDYIWFNANFTAGGIPSSGATINFTNSTIQFTADQNYTLAVPNAQITFSPSAQCTSTSFDSITNTWMTTVPVSGDDEIFLSGLAFPVPAGFANVGGRVTSNVVWSGTFSSSTGGVSMQWKWGAAVYTSFTTNYNQLNVKAGHQHACGMNNGDHAGTPEGTNPSTGQPWGRYVTGGARGGGGSNFTGSWSGTLSVSPACPSSAIIKKLSLRERGAFCKA